jgi:transcriptional regulator
MAPGDRNFLPGTLELLVLRALKDGAAHGFAVSKDIRHRSEGVVDLNDGAIYQALHRLENDGVVASHWGHSDKGKRAKFYALTEAGLRRLGAEARAWHRFADAVARILGPEYGKAVTSEGAR